MCTCGHDALDHDGWCLIVDPSTGYECPCRGFEDQDE